MIKTIKFFKENQDGAAAVEFALTAPFLIYIFVGVIDFGFYINEKMIAEQAARSGVEFVIKNGDDEDALLSAVLAAFFPEEYEDDPSMSSIDITIDEVCECAGGVVIQCTETCDDEDDYRRRYQEVTFGYNYNMHMSYPGLTDGNIYLEGTARMQKD